MQQPFVFVFPEPARNIMCRSASMHTLLLLEWDIILYFFWKHLHFCFSSFSFSFQYSIFIWIWATAVLSSGALSCNYIYYLNKQTKIKWSICYSYDHTYNKPVFSFRAYAICIYFTVLGLHIFSDINSRICCY